MTNDPTSTLYTSWPRIFDACQKERESRSLDLGTTKLALFVQGVIKDLERQRKNDESKNSSA